MAQHDYDIANASGATVRADINNVLDAIASQNSGSSAPSTTFAYEWWFDTNNNLLKIRNGANNAWVTIAELSGNDWKPYYLTTKLDLISQAAAEAGTATSAALWSAQRVKQAIDALASSGAFSFTSSEQTVTTDTILDVAHGLGAVPERVLVVLRCKTTDLGYAVNDEVHFGGSIGGGGDGSVTIYADGTNVTIVQGVAIQLHSQSTLNLASINVANWKWEVRAS